MKFHTESRKARTFWFVILATLFAFVAPRALYAQAQGEALVSQGQAQYEQGDYANAIRTLESYVGTYPNGANRNTAELYLGCSYLALQNGENAADNEIARRHFKYILDQGSTAKFYLDASFHDARSYYGQKDYATAKPKLRQFVASNPNDSLSEFAYYYLGICEEDAGSFQDAISYFDQSLKTFPNSKYPVKWYCQLEKATLTGKLGQYAQADQQLASIYNAPGVPADVAGKATIQRALLFLVQQKSDEALKRLEEFLSRYQVNSSNVATFQEVYLYEAYAYFAQKDVQHALARIETIQKLSDSLPPEAATLKIKLLLNLKRFDEAQAILNALQNSSYGADCPDIITTHQAMIYLAQGKRDLVLQTLNPLLDLHRYRENQPDLYFGYYDKQNVNHLIPIDFVEACGVLTLAYAGIYANSSAATSGAPPTQDVYYNAQNYVFKATKEYADKLNDPAVNLVVAAIDKGRQNILSHPGANDAQANVSVLAPSYSPTTNVMGSGGFVNPTDPSQFRDPGFQNNMAAPAYSGYGPANAATNPAGAIPNNNAVGANPSAQTLSSGLPGAPANPGGVNPYATNPNGAPAVAGTPASVPPYGQQQGGYQPNGVPNYAANTQPYLNTPNATSQQASYPNAQTPGVESGANVATENVPLTQREAQDALDKATSYFKNLDFDRANEILLETTTKSETFWTDCPKEAARITLLRAWALYELEKYAEAQMACEDLVSHAPTSPEGALANFSLGKLADSLGRTEEAIKRLREACAVDFPYVDEALYYLATNELEQGSVNDAALDFEKLYRDYPRSAYWSHAVWRLAKIESDLRRDRQAETLVNEALAKRPDASIIDYLLFLKGEIALRAKDYDKALVAFDMIVDQYPDSVWYSRAKNRIAAVPERFKNADGYVEDDYDYDVPAPPAPAVRPNTERPANPATGANPRSDAESAPRLPSTLDSFPSDRATNPAANRRVDDEYDDERYPATGAASRATTPTPAASTAARPTTTPRPTTPANSATNPTAGSAGSRRSTTSPGSTAPASTRGAGTR